MKTRIAENSSKGMLTRVSALILACCCISPMEAQWKGVGAGGTGADFGDSANWVDGDINGDFSTITNSATIAVDGEQSIATDLDLTWTGRDIQLTFDGAGTIRIDGSLLYSGAEGASVTIEGGVTLDFGQIFSPREIGSIENALPLVVHGKVVSDFASEPGRIEIPRGSVILNNPENAFDAPIHLSTTHIEGTTLRFSSIGNVGGGTTSLGTPSNPGNGSITLYRNAALAYTGSDDQITDRQIRFDPLNNLGPRGVSHLGKAGRLVFTSDIDLGAYANVLRLQAQESAAVLEFTGAINSEGLSGNLELSINTSGGTGTVVLANPLSNFLGVVKIQRGVLEVSKLGDGGQESSIGAGTSDADTLHIGGWGNTMTTLRYVGKGDTSDRLFTIGASSVNVSGAIESSGEGPIQFTNPGAIKYGAPNQERIVVLRGSNTNANVLSAAIANNGDKSVRLRKADAGTWILAGNANTYTGGTIVDAGTLLINSTSGNGIGENNIDVKPEARLGGTGLIALKGESVIVSGTLLGGNGAQASGTLSIQAPVIMETDSVLEFVLGNGKSSSIAGVSGEAERWMFASSQRVRFSGAIAPGNYPEILKGVSPDLDVSKWKVMNDDWNGTFINHDGNIGVRIVPEPGRVGANALVEPIIPPFMPEGPDSRIAEWMFQPGERVDKMPDPGEWEAVRLPFLWTQGAARMISPEDRTLAEWARDPKLWSAYDNGWFERTVRIPEDWDGSRVWLAFDQVECDGMLWVNESEPIFLPGPEARVDITEYLQPGKDAVLRVWITRWWEGIPIQMEDDILRHSVLQSYGNSQIGGVAALRPRLPAGIPGHITLEKRPMEAEITGLFARPSFREKALDVDVDILASASTPGTSLRLELLDPGGEGGGMPEAITVPLKVMDDGTQTVRIPWESPRLWQMGDGYLYKIKASLVRDDGAELHVLNPVSFGFREVWVDGREIVMNGRPVRLRMAPVVFPHWPALLFWEGIGFNTMQWHPNSHSWYLWNGRRSLIIEDEYNPEMRRIRPDVIEQADKRGFALLMPAPNISFARGTIVSEAGDAAFERETRLWFDKLRNHPSIIMWNPSMNTGSGNRENPERIGTLPQEDEIMPAWYGKSIDIIKRVDPTRIVAHHNGMGGEVDYPNQYLNFMPLQERIEFPSKWASEGDIPWGAIEHGTPYSRNFMKPGGVPQYSEWHAAYFGDRAYDVDSDKYVKIIDQIVERKAYRPRADEIVEMSKATMQYEFDILFNRETNRAWRTWGVAGGWKPWNFYDGYGVSPKQLGKEISGEGGGYFYTELTEEEALASIEKAPEWANPIYHTFRETMQPLLVYLGGDPVRFTSKDHAFRSGENFEKSVVVVWDGNTEQELQAKWALAADGKILTDGTETIALKPGDIVKRPISLTAPGVSERTDARLTLTVTSSDGEQIEDSMELSFWPPEPELKTDSIWAIYDPVGKSAAWLKTLGLDLIPVASASELESTGAQVLVVGREAFDQEVPFGPEQVAQGLRVLILEQQSEVLESIDLRAQDIVTRYTFPRDLGHEVLDSIAAQDLSNWRGEPDLLPKTKDGMRPWPLARPPRWGNYGAVASVVIETPTRGAFTPILDAEFDLSYTPLLEWRHGLGGVVFSQFDLTDRTELDPVARKIAGNLVRSLDKPFPAPANKVVNFLGNEDQWKYIEDLGLKARHVDRDALSGLDATNDILVIGSDQWTLLDGQVAGQEFVRNGGSALVLPQSAESLAAAPERLRLATTRITATRANVEYSPLVRGIGPQMLNWRTTLTQDRFNTGAAPAQASVLLDGLVLKLPDEKGRWIFSQLDWMPLEDGSNNLEKQRWHTKKLYRQLLTNLGARTSEKLTAGMFQSRLIAPMVNVDPWRVWNDVARVEPVRVNRTFPALADRLPMETAVADVGEGDSANDSMMSTQLGDGEAASPGLADSRESAGWRTYGPRGSSGRVHLEWISPTEMGKIGGAYTYVFSSREREALFAVGADYWMVFRVNGRAYVDHSSQPRPANAPFAGEFRFKAPLKKGWNRLEMKVASGGSGFGFWALVSDPGDMIFSTNPRGVPEVAADAVLAEEPDLETEVVFYPRPMKPADDPYRFNPW